MQIRFLKLSFIPKIAFLGIFFLAINLNTLSAKDSLYMLPYEKSEALKALIASIKSASKEINIAIYSFTHKQIEKALRDKASKGVKINIIYDKSQNKDENKFSTIGSLAKFKNIYTCRLEGLSSKNKKYNGIMHQKLVIVDDKELVLGSANWSKNAFENSYETLFLTNNKEVINKARSYYDKMLKTCVPFIK